MQKRQFNPFTKYPPKGDFKTGTIDTGQFPSLTLAEFDVIEKEFAYPFTSVGLLLPFCIHLEDGIYPVKLKNNYYVIKHVKTNRKEILYFGGKGDNVEMPEDPRGLFRFSCCEVFLQNVYSRTIDDSSLKSEIVKVLDLMDFPTMQKLSLTVVPQIQNIKLAPFKIERIKNLSMQNLKARLHNVASKMDILNQHKLYERLISIILVKHARLAINRFIEVYRFNTRAYYMPSFRNTDILSATICQFNNGGNVEKSAAIYYPNGLTLSVPDRSIEDHKKIWDILDNDKIIEIYDQMLHTSQRYMLEENYYSAVVETFSAFEIFIERMLISAIISMGKSKQEAENYISRDHNWQITVRVKDLLKDILGLDLSINKDYHQWILAKRLRDEIIHDGKRNVLESEALSAISSVNKLLEIVREAVRKRGLL